MQYLKQLLAPLASFRQRYNAPVAVNEFGVKRWSPNAAAYFADMAGLLEKIGVNRALWIWETSYPGLAEVDDFNFRHGPDAANHADVADSDLIGAIRADWSLNELRP